MDIDMVGVYKAQIKYYEIMIKQTNAVGDILWYQSQIKDLEEKIKELGG